LVDNLSQFSSTNEVIVVEQIALGLRDDTAPLATYVEGNDGMMTLFPQNNLEILFQQDVQILALDSYFKMKLDSLGKNGFLLKIDVEGGKLDVISGGRNFIKECQPRIVMEVNSLLLSHANATSRMVFELMAQFGYSSFWLDERGAISLVKNFDFPPHETILGRESDANYLFLPGQLDSASAVAKLNFAKYFTWNF
jgi:FkbM family methyltransferase